MADRRVGKVPRIVEAGSPPSKAYVFVMVCSNPLAHGGGESQPKLAPTGSHPHRQTGRTKFVLPSMRLAPIPLSHPSPSFQRRAGGRNDIPRVRSKANARTRWCGDSLIGDGDIKAHGGRKSGHQAHWRLWPSHDFIFLSLTLLALPSFSWSFVLVIRLGLRGSSPAQSGAPLCAKALPVH